MADYTPNWQSDPTARVALGNASGFRTVQIMSDKEVEKHRKKTQTWNARREEERRLAIEKKKNKMRRQNAELHLRANAIIKMGLKFREFERYLLANYDGTVKEIERREFHKLVEEARILFGRYEKLIVSIANRNNVD